MSNLNNPQDIFMESVLVDDVRAYAGMSSDTLSETLYKSNVLPGHITATNESFTPVFSSYELLDIKRAVRICHTIDYYLWAFDHKLPESAKIKGRKNSKTLKLLLSGIHEGSYKIEFINQKMYLKSNSSYGYTKKYSYGRLYPIKLSISHISREFRYYLFKNLYNDVDIINAHPTILYDYATTRNIALNSLGELVNNREIFYEKVLQEYSDYKVTPKKLALIALNMNKTNFRSNLLNDLTRDLNHIRDQLYEEFYLNDSKFRSAIDIRCEENPSEQDIRMKTQSLFCFNKETECLLSFKSFYLENIDAELRDNSSFIPFFDGMYIYTDTITSLDVYNMQSTHIQADLEKIISMYNSTNTIQFKSKPIEMEDTLISRDIFNKIQHSIDLVERLSYKEVINELKSLNVDDKLIKPLINILDSQPKEFSFNYNQLTEIQFKVKALYNELIHGFMTKNHNESQIS